MRTRFGHALSELHARLRTEGDSPLRTACAVGLGVFIGCFPIYGAHFLLSMVLAPLFGLNRITTYLASHINNPFSAPVLLVVELGVGHWVHSGAWPRPSLAQISLASVWDLGRELFTGAAVIGLVLAIVLGGACGLIRSRRRPAEAWDLLCERACRRYIASGILHWEFVRGKLRHDPLYRQLLESGMLPNEGRLVDLGCGRGILFALIQSAGELHLPPQRRLLLEGVERRPSMARVAEEAVGGGAHITVADVVDYALGPCDAILMLDVLHYLRPTEQERVLRLAGAALLPNGSLLIREPDAALGARFLLTRLGERLCALGRLHWRQRFHYRSSTSWAALLERQGLAASVRPLWSGTPLANVLIHARRPAKSSASTGPEGTSFSVA